jgi:hypothetical protein
MFPKEEKGHDKLKFVQFAVECKKLLFIFTWRLPGALVNVVGT